MKKATTITTMLLLAAAGIMAQQKNFPRLTGPYLGQAPPGTTPEIFAPGIISMEVFHDFKGAFSPDGNEYYFCRHSLPDIPQTLYYTKVVNGCWTEPAKLKIAEGPRTFHPCITLDNRWLLFYWKFMKDSSGRSGYYAASRSDDGWSTPEYAGQGMCATTDVSGFLYVTEIVKGSPPVFYMNRVTFDKGIFTGAERIHIQTHSGKQTHPCIAPDGSYLVFDIQEEDSHLFVCFKEKNGKWGDVFDLTDHGLQEGARNGYMSPDGKYLFYGYKNDIWWVDARIIMELKPKKLKQRKTNE